MSSCNIHSSACFALCLVKQMSGEQQQEGESSTHDCDFLTVFFSLATDFTENLNYINFLRLATIIKVKCTSLSLQESSAEGTCWKRRSGLTLGATCWKAINIDTAGTEFPTVDPLGLRKDEVLSHHRHSRLIWDLGKPGGRGLGGA